MTDRGGWERLGADRWRLAEDGDATIISGPAATKFVETLTSKAPTKRPLEESELRAGCCDAWPKPCSYHEGYLDGFEHGEPE